MSGFDGFLGNNRLVAMLKRDIRMGRFFHAYIIEGEEGYGKYTLAKLIASAVSCGEDDPPCMKCIFCDKIAREQAPDVKFIEAEKDKVQLGVDVIRKLREDCVYAPIELPRKFYVIKDADKMNQQAQNALLKTLEEPPSHVMFLILCENADNLLSTIRSRAPVLRLEALPDDTILHYLKSRKEIAVIAPEKLNAAVKMARGSLGKAISLADGEGTDEYLAMYKKAEKYMELLANKKGATGEFEFYEYASKLTSSKKRDELDGIYSLISDAVRDLINAKLTSSPKPIFYASAEAATDLSHKFTLSSLMRLSDVFAEARIDVSRNINMGLSQVQSASAAADACNTR